MARSHGEDIWPARLARRRVPNAEKAYWRVHIELVLRCDRKGCDSTYDGRWRDPTKICGESKGEIKKCAKKMGWIFHKDGTTTCPFCNIDGKSERDGQPSSSSYDSITQQC